MPHQPQHPIPEEFAGNEWLVDELFEKYRSDKNSVDEKWWPIFEAMNADNGSATEQSNAAEAQAASSAPSAGLLVQRRDQGAGDPDRPADRGDLP